MNFIPYCPVYVLRLGKQYVYLEQRWNTRISPNRVTDSVSILLISLVDIPFRLIWTDLWVVGLLCTLRESISSHFFRLHWSIMKLFSISIGSLFGLIRTYSPLGASVISNCEIHAKQSTHHDHAAIYIESFHVLNLKLPGSINSISGIHQRFSLRGSQVIAFIVQVYIPTENTWLFLIGFMLSKFSYTAK